MDRKGTYVKRCKIIGFPHTPLLCSPVIVVFVVELELTASPTVVFVLELMASTLRFEKLLIWSLFTGCVEKL